MPPAFHLAVGGSRLATLTFDAPDRKVNVFSRPVFAELEALLAELATRNDIAGLVLVSGKDASFIAGADLDEIARVTDPIEAEAGVRVGQRLFAAWEALPFPTIAAIRGICLGGGTELALASTWRVASDRPDTRIGLPEVRLGILPAWGGSTRLPARIGLAAALDMILTGKAVSGRSALKSGLVDALVPEARFFDLVRDFALEHLAGGERRRKDAGNAGWKGLLLEKNPLGRKIVFDQARKKTLEQTHGHYPAPLRAIEVVRVGVEDGPRAGFEAEARAAAELATSRVAKNLIHVFRLGEEAKKDQGVAGAAPREVHAVGVLGAGTMGGGIAQLVAQEAGIPVRLKDVDTAALARGMEHAAGLFDRLVKKRRLTRAEERRKMALIQPTLDYRGFGRLDLVIEAIVEKLAVKQAVFAEVAAAVPEDAVLASNTSSLPIGAIGERTPRPERVVGMHFFNPVHRMPLVEVMAAAASEPAAVNTAYAFARRLGKTPVLVKDSPGFLVNRLLGFYTAEALWLLDEGYTIETIDRAMVDWGMPLGPLALTDEVGIDVASKVAPILHEAFPDRLVYPTWLERAAAPDRLGTKTGRGFYRYEGRERKEADPGVYALLGLGARAQEADPGLLADRMVLPMVNEAARCLAEGVVRSAAELDLAMIYGTGFPPFRGGLCRWADLEGGGEVVAALERLESAVSERYRPSEALRETAAAGGFYGRGAGAAGK
jgi:3-hydroxyacyl-CoA dehydrogenase/enoyl-CoA hydratase/3-hydroxybutyryl-CoA epimerase